MSKELQAESRMCHLRRQTVASRRLISKASALALTVVLLSATAAFSHAGIPNSPTFGNQPNPRGGTGASGQTPPYAPNTIVTLNIRMPDEVSTLNGGFDDNTVDVKVRIPSPWTAPACVTNGATFNKSDASTNNTNQPGDPVPAWSCLVEDTTAGGTAHKVVHYSGPASTSTVNNSGAQFFAVRVTTPAPAVQTIYNESAGNGEGFFATQTYASGALRYWKPSAITGTGPADFPEPVGTAGYTSSTPASGLTRTVLATGNTTAVPSGSPVAQTLTVTVPESSEFSLTIPGSNPAVTLGAAAPNPGYLQFTGSINSVVVTDSRASKPAWSVSGQVGNFGAIDGKHLGWTPSVVNPGAGASAGPNIPSGIGGANTDGLKTARTLASATAGHDLGSATLGAALDLRVPLGTPAGTYTATLTLTAI